MSRGKAKKMDEKKIYDEFRLRLKRIRKTMKLTQEEFARGLGASKPAYVRYETGELMPKSGLLLALSEKYKVNLNWLVNGAGNMFLPEDHGEDGPVTPGKSAYEEARENLEVFRLLEVPEVRTCLLAEVSKLKKIFASEIAAFEGWQKQG